MSNLDDMNIEIDILDITDPKYSALSQVQLAMVISAQKKKNKVLREAEEEKERLLQMLLANNFARSTARLGENARIDEDAQIEIDIIKSDLVKQIDYDTWLTEGNENGVYRYPENPNYNLNYSQRFLVVRQYYMDVTSNAEARLQAYAMDSLARSYLGEYYATLYDLLASYC